MQKSTKNTKVKNKIKTLGRQLLVQKSTIHKISDKIFMIRDQAIELEKYSSGTFVSTLKNPSPPPSLHLKKALSPLHPAWKMYCPPPSTLMPPIQSKYVIQEKREARWIWWPYWDIFYICKGDKQCAAKSSVCTKVYLENWFAPPSIHLEKFPAPPPPTLKNVSPPSNAEVSYASSIAWSLRFYQALNKIWPCIVK